MKSDLIIKEHKIAVRVDEENNLLYAFDLDLDNNVDESSEGILNYVNAELANKIEDSLGISISKYGVAITECVTSFPLCK
jgi:hypothetical protein